MKLELTAGTILAAAIVAPSFWIGHARLPRGVGKSGGAAIFTAAITVFVLAPMVFAGWALLTKTHTLLQRLAAADGTGRLPSWLAGTPVVVPWRAARRQQLVPRDARDHGQSCPAAQ